MSEPIIKLHVAFDVGVSDSFAIMGTIPSEPKPPAPAERMQDADALIHGFGVMLAEYGKDVRVTGDGLRAIRDGHRVKVTYDKYTDTYSFSCSPKP